MWTEAGAYSFATTANGCSATSASINVVVNELPAVPPIEQVSDSLVTTGAGTFQWFFNGMAVTGATDAWLIPAAYGTYTVVYTDTNGCSTTSDEYAYITTLVMNTAQPFMQILPNPSDGAFTIVLARSQGKYYEVLDATGKRVVTDKFTGINTAVDLRDAPNGVYFLRMVQSGNVPVQRIVINR